MPMPDLAPDWIPPLGFTPWADAEHEAQFIEAILASRTGADSWNSIMRQLIDDFADFLVEQITRRDATKRKRALRVSGHSVTGFRRGRRPRF